MSRTHVLIINWNNAADTIACIGSVMHDDSSILILDNASADDSVARILDYLDGQKVAYHATTLAKLATLPPVQERILFVESNANLGFAGGNNALLRYSMRCPDAAYAWLLNNDATAGLGALDALVRKLDDTPQAAFAGSVVLDFEKTGLIQSCGVKYYPFFGVSKLILKNQQWETIDKATIPYNEIDFQHGASLFVRLSALTDIGLMDERYFLYFEEQDWQYAAKEMGYTNVLCTESVIQHKGSVSTNNKKHLFFYYYNRSAIMFMRKHSKPLVRAIASLMLMLITILRSKGYMKSIIWGIKGAIEGYSR